MTKQDAQKVMNTYNELDKGIVNRDHINEAYELLPTKLDFSNEKSRIMAIKRYVMFNNQELTDILHSPEPAQKKAGRPKKNV